MNRFRSILGLVVGAMMIVSGAAHSILGWPEVNVALEQARLPADLIRAVGIGWNFGGVAMLAFGSIVATSFTQRLRGREVSLAPAIVIGATYVAFGAGSLLATRFDPFFLVFVVPGVLLLFASLPRRAA